MSQKDIVNKYYKQIIFVRKTNIYNLLKYLPLHILHDSFIQCIDTIIITESPQIQQISFESVGALREGGMNPPSWLMSIRQMT